ncbi:MAG: excisionase family DNA-binding protein [Treponema sp.]|nr:excisionase family DNA-binding protein [Treponema sp.]
MSYQTVYRMIRSGQIAAWKDGENNWCIGRADIRRFCAENSNR